MAPVTPWLLGLGLVAVISMIGFGVFASWPHKKGEGTSPRRALLDGALLFLTLSCWFSLLFPLLAWMFWLGDNRHIFYDTSHYVAAVAALAYAIFVVARIRSGRVSHRYVLIHRWCSVFLLLLLGGT